MENLCTIELFKRSVTKFFDSIKNPVYFKESTIHPVNKVDESGIKDAKSDGSIISNTLKKRYVTGNSIYDLLYFVDDELNALKKTKTWVNFQDIYKFKTYANDCQRTHKNGQAKMKNVSASVMQFKNNDFTHNLDDDGILTINYGKNLRSSYKFYNIELISDCEIIPFIVPPALKFAGAPYHKNEGSIFHSENMSFRTNGHSLYWVPILDKTCEETHIDTGIKIKKIIAEHPLFNRGFSALLSDGLKGERQKFKIDVSAKTKKALLIACRAYGNCEEIRVSYHGSNVLTIGDYEIDCDITGEMGTVEIENRKFKNVLTKAHTVVVLDNVIMFHGKDNSGGIVK